MDAVATFEFNSLLAARPEADNELQQAEASDLLLLLQQAAGGHTDALGKIYDRTRSAVYGMCLRILRHPADAEEAALDVYTQAWQAARHFDASRGSVTAWLLMMARSRSIDRLRSRARHHLCDALEAAPQLLATTPNPEQNALRAAEQQRIRQAMAQLPPAQRQVLELAFFYGFTHSELACKLNQPLGTIKTRVRAALSSLRLGLKGSPEMAVS